MPYAIRENTNDRTHPSVETVIDTALDRAENPRDDHPNGHLDDDLNRVVAEHGNEAVDQCIRLHLTEGLPHRTCGQEVFDEHIAGIITCTAATAYLREITADDVYVE